MPDKCHTCGRFFSWAYGFGWKMLYSGYPPQPDREIYRCAKCLNLHGTFEAQHGIVASSSCGAVHAPFFHSGPLPCWCGVDHSANATTVPAQRNVPGNTSPPAPSAMV